MKYVKKTIELLRDNVVNSTAVLACTCPVYAFLETNVFKMTHYVSMNARYNVALLMYGGLGLGITVGRELSRSLFKITDKTNEWTQLVHDGLYTFAISLPINPLFYLWAGETDVRKITIGTFVNAGLGALAGPIFGYVVDVYRDLAGVEECERPIYPKVIKGLKPVIKKCLAVSVIGASVGLTGMVYSLTPDKPENRARVENVINNPQEEPTKQLYSEDF